MTARSSRDGRRHSRFIRGNEHGFEICTVDHSKGGVLRLDATVTYADECAADGEACSTLVFAHDHEDYDHDLWFQAYVPQEGDGCYIENPDGVINMPGSELDDLSDPNAVCWWHMKDGAVLGVHNGMIIEYDESTLAPLGMVVSRDELQGRRVAVVDNGYGGSTCLLYDDENNSEVTVVQPNEDGTYWRKVVRNKMYRMKEMRRRRRQELLQEDEGRRRRAQRALLLRTLHRHRRTGHGHLHPRHQPQGGGQQVKRATMAFFVGADERGSRGCAPRRRD